MRQALRQVASGLAIALLTATTAWAQAGATAQISGTVRDSSGAVLPGVDVTATQTDTNFVRSTVTDAGGNYVLSNLPTGPYRLQATLSGFRTFQRTGIVLQVNANPEIIIEMAIGELAETVSVEAATPLVETRSPGIGQVIENERIEELPLNGRNPTELIALAGAAVPQPALNAIEPQHAGRHARLPSPADRPSAWPICSTAPRTTTRTTTSICRCRFPTRCRSSGSRPARRPPTTACTRAPRSTSVTKSGTNLLPRRPVRVRPQSPLQRDQPVQRDQSGDRRAAGRRPEPQPVRRHARRPVATDRLFFFGAYQGTRLRETPADLFAFVPTAAMLAGDFTQYASAQCNSDRRVNLRAPFVNNRINPALFSPAALKSRRAAAQRRPTRAAASPTAAAGRRTKRSTSARSTCSSARTTRCSAATCSPRSSGHHRSQLQPDNILVSSQGGRDNKAHVVHRRRHDGAQQHDGQRHPRSPTTTPTSTARTSRSASRRPISASRPTATSRTTCSSA